MLLKLLKVLNSLPFDGSKVKIGAWLTGLAAIWGSITSIDPEIAQHLLALLSAHPINWIGVGILLLGILHKWLKAKYRFLA